RRPVNEYAGEANMPRTSTSSGSRKADRPRAGAKPTTKKNSSHTALAKTRGNGAIAATPKSTARAPRTVDRRSPERAVQGRRAVTAEPVGNASRGKYVYCIIESSDPLRFGPIGLGLDPSDVYTVHYQNLGAVVSDAPREVL